MLQVELADPAITVHGWTAAMDRIGEYTLKLRKTPEEMKAEKERLRARFGGKPKINPMKYEKSTVIEHDADDPNTVYFLPGLWPRVKKWFEDHNVEYEITADNRDPKIRPPIDVEAIKDVQFRKAQDVALALIATSDCGIIEALTGFGKSYLFGVICKAFPTLNILITTDSTSVIQTIYTYLCQQVPGQVGILMGGKNTTHGKRIVVSTIKSLCKISETSVNLLLADECHCVNAGTYGKEIMRFCWARKFGFSASPIRNDGSQLVLESIFGPTVLKLDYDEGVDEGMVVPMRYAMLPCNWAPSICNKEGLNDVLLKRYAYWRNKVRNQAIADFVKRLNKVAPDAQVLLICSTLEHCIALNMMLPNYKVLYYGATSMADMEKHFPKDKYPNLDLTQYKMTQKQLDIGRNAFAKGTLKRVISTMILKQGVNAPNLRVLIRCDGATSKILGIQIPGRLARLAEGKDCGYLIDVSDGGSPWTKRRADCREALYKEQGWTKITPEDVLHDFIGQATTDNTEHT